MLGLNRLFQKMFVIVCFLSIVATSRRSRNPSFMHQRYPLLSRCYACMVSFHIHTMSNVYLLVNEYGGWVRLPSKMYQPEPVYTTESYTNLLPSPRVLCCTMYVPVPGTLVTLDTSTYS